MSIMPLSHHYFFQLVPLIRSFISECSKTRRYGECSWRILSYLSSM